MVLIVVKGVSAYGMLGIILFLKSSPRVEELI